MPERPRLQQIRIFLSSPGDVAVERKRVREIADELSKEFWIRDRAVVTVVSWDDPAAQIPILAQLTPQESVNRGMPKPSACDIVVVVLWSRMGTPLPPEFKKVNGKSYLSGTEWEYEDAFGADSQPDILVYRRTEATPLYPNDPELHAKLAQWKLVEQFFARFRNTDGSLAGGTTEYDGPSTFAELVRKNLRERVAAKLESSSRPPTEDVEVPSSAAAPAWTGSPYPGLRTFASEQAPIFFGRGREVDALVARLRDPKQRFLAVVGASGSGKSSLVRAGLLPRLVDGAIEGSRHWRLLEMKPSDEGENPFLALAAGLKPLLPDHLRRPSSEVAEELAEAPQRVLGHVPALLTGRQISTVLMLFVDQFEELFAPAAENHRGAFLKLLAHATSAPRVYVLITVREDFLSRCVSEPALTPLLQTGIFMLAPPGPAALADMIRRPAERAGLELEKSLDDEILRDAGGEPGKALPLVAFCLEELYERDKAERRLTLDTYRRALGGLGGAIRRRADMVLQKLREAEGAALDRALPRVFRALVRVDAAGAATRQRASRDELRAMPPPIPHLVETLIDGRLLTTEETSGRATVTLTHEALLQEWPALNEWLEGNRARMQSVQRILLSLQAPELAHRQFAVKALGNSDPEEVGAAAPTLAAALGSDIEPGMRAAIATALARIGPAADVVPALAKALAGDADAGVRCEVATALGALGSTAAAAVVLALMAALGDGDTRVREAAAIALGNFGPAAAKADPKAVPALSAILRDASSGVRWAAAEALGRIGDAAIPSLIHALSRPGRDVHEAVIDALGRIAPPAVQAVPAVAASLRHSDPDVRRTAAEALGRIGEAAVPALLAALADADRGTCVDAFNAFKNTGSASMAALHAALPDATRNVRRVAAETLGYVDQVAMPTARVVLEESSNYAPALAALGNTMLAMAWTGTDHRGHLNIITSRDGRTWTKKITLPEYSTDGPALAACDETLFVAWKGTDAACHIVFAASTDGGHTFGQKTILNATSSFGPALAYGSGQLFLAWVGREAERRLNVMSTSDGVHWADRVTLPESSGSAPALCWADDRLHLAWRAWRVADPGQELNIPARELNIMESTDGKTWTNKRGLEHTSDFRPALAQGTSLVLCWTGRFGERRLNIIERAAGMRGFGAKTSYADTAVDGVGLAYFKGVMLAAWASAESTRHLNIRGITPRAVVNAPVGDTGD